MRFVFPTYVVALATTGCLSTATMQARRDAQVALERPPWPPMAEASEHAAPRDALDASSCSALARGAAFQHPRERATVRDPEIRILCDEIRRGQQAEIEQMTTKLKALDGEAGGP